MTGFLPERPQYELACCCAPSCRKIATIAVSETILFRVMPLQNDRSPSNPLQNGLCSLASNMPPQSERSSSHIPHHSKSCPYKMRGFLPSTYNRGWHCCSIFLSFSQAYNLRLWFGFLTPIMWFLPKKSRHTHTEQQSFKLGFWSLLDLLQNGYLEFVASKLFWMFQNAQGPSKPTFCLQNGSYIMVENSIRKPF